MYEKRVVYYSSDYGNKKFYNHFFLKQDNDFYNKTMPKYEMEYYYSNFYNGHTFVKKDEISKIIVCEICRDSLKKHQENIKMISTVYPDFKMVNFLDPDKKLLKNHLVKIDPATIKSSYSNDCALLIDHNNCSRCEFKFLENIGSNFKVKIVLNW